MYENLYTIKEQSLFGKVCELTAGKRFFVVYDALLSDLHSPKIVDLIAAQECVGSISVAVSEQSKTLEGVARICHQMLQSAVGRADIIVAVGGGVLTDMAGFSAAIYKRGIAWLAVPTTLIGMVDAAIGGKTAVNTAWGKNSLGSFHLPQAVILDKSFLTTLSDEEWQNGRAECLKYCFLDARFKLVDNMAELSAFKRYVENYIERFASYKQALVARDLEDHAMRRILNFGHTFGHAYESAYSYRGLRHGEAVMLGMQVALYISRQVCALDKAVLADYSAWLKVQPHYRAIEKLPFSQLVDYLVGDKKAHNGAVVMVLLEALGRPRLQAFDVDQLATLYDEYYESNHY